MSTTILDRDRIFKHSIPEPNSGCWLWTGCLSKDGYAQTNKMSGHRLSYIAFKGPIEPGNEIDHKCRVRCCVNPDHLRSLSHAENIAYGIYPKETHRNSSKTHCKRGHPLSGDNLFIELSGARKCKTCRNENQNARYRKNINPAALAKALRTHCPQGHEYNAENTRIGSDGHRQCKQCDRDRNNRAAMLRKVPQKTHCINGHAYAETLVFSKGGRARCSACHDTYRENNRLKRKKDFAPQAAT